VFKNLFRSVKEKPTNYNELRKMYITIIKNITVNDIVISKRIHERAEGKRGEYEYSLNKKLIKQHLELNNLKNKGSLGFHDGLRDLIS